MAKGWTKEQMVVIEGTYPSPLAAAEPRPFTPPRVASRGVARS